MRQHHILPAPQIRLARSQLMENGTTSVQGLDLGVSRSWHRSLAAGLSPVGRISAIDNLSSFELQRMRSLNHDLISHSQPVMEYLLDQVSNTQSMVILSDHQGVLMHTMGDLAFLTKAERVALMCGASWHETQRGTNAIGTALAEMCDVEIHGGEHFLERNGFLTCAAAPIMSALAMCRRPSGPEPMTTTSAYPRCLRAHATTSRLQAMQVCAMNCWT